MSGTPTTSKMSIVAAGEPTLFDSLARLVPKDLQTAYYRVLAHTRTLSPDDEMLRILEAMGTLALLTRHTPKDIADERERFQEMFELHQQFSEEAQQKTLRYVHELESRLSGLPSELEAGLDPEQIAKLLGESLRQHFLNSGIPDTVKGLQATSIAMTTAQKELSTALRNLSDSRGAVAQIESANNRLTYSLDNRAKAVDALLREVRSDLSAPLDSPHRRCDSLDRTVWRHGHSKLAGFSSDRCNANPHHCGTGPIARAAAGSSCNAGQPKAATP